MSAPTGRNVPARGERSVTPGASETPGIHTSTRPRGATARAWKAQRQVTRGETPGDAGSLPNGEGGQGDGAIPLPYFAATRSTAERGIQP